MLLIFYTKFKPREQNGTSRLEYKDINTCTSDSAYTVTEVNKHVT